MIEEDISIIEDPKNVDRIIQLGDGKIFFGNGLRDLGPLELGRDTPLDDSINLWDWVSAPDLRRSPLAQMFLAHVRASAVYQEHLAQFPSVQEYAQTNLLRARKGELPVTRRVDGSWHADFIHYTGDIIDAEGVKYPTVPTFQDFNPAHRFFLAIWHLGEVGPEQGCRPTFIIDPLVVQNITRPGLTAFRGFHQNVEEALNLRPARQSILADGQVVSFTQAGLHKASVAKSDAARVYARLDLVPPRDRGF